jgi:hypothetical protein
MAWISVDEIQHYMITINRKPIKTSGGMGSTTIQWKCHGINQHGRRIYWDEVTYTVATEIFNPMTDKTELCYQTERFVGPFAMRIF